MMNLRMTARGGWAFELSDEEMELCEKMGRDRYRASRDGNFKNLREASEDAGDIDKQGAMGEMGVAKILNLYLDPTPGKDKGKDEDLVCIDGLTIDAKATRKYWGPLPIPCRTRKENDIYVLVICSPDSPEVEVVGWIWGDDAMQDRYLSVSSRGSDEWHVPLGDLLPIEELVRDENPSLYNRWKETMDEETTD